MEIREVNNNDVLEVITIWNKSKNDNDFLYSKLTEEKFIKLFLEENDDIEKFNIVAIDDGKVVGFGSGLNQRKADKAYITMILVEESYRRRRVGTSILDVLENKIKDEWKVEKSEISFFNPVNLNWDVPYKNGVDHPNAPGVDYSAIAFKFFLANGYDDSVKQNSYYINLVNFNKEEMIRQYNTRLIANRVECVFYDKDVHYGFDELFTNLNNELWRNVINENLAKENSNPILILAKDNKVVGFTGPLHVQESKRGYFAGIGVDPEIRNCGGGKVLFYSLCKGLKDMGAKYMTLFT